MTWSAQQYVKFEDERTRPVRDLLSAVPFMDAAQVVDIGCGPGNSTELLVARHPKAAALGFDSSSDMIDEARKRLPAVRFEIADVAAWASTQKWDLILANAVLQWLPDHDTLLPRLAGMLNPGGSLAVQMPDNLGEVTHLSMVEIAKNGPWAAKLAAAAEQRTGIASPTHYYKLLRGVSSRVDVWKTVYHFTLAGGPGAIVEWFKGTGLRPFLAPLTPDEAKEYLRRYEAAMAKAYPVQPDGSVLLPFPRIFMVATK